MPFAYVDSISLLQKESGHVMVGVSERDRLHIFELALDHRGLEPVPWETLQHEQVMPFRVHLQEVDARDVLSLEYFGKRRGIDRLFRDMARMERGQPTDPAALIRPIESKPGADAVTDSTLVQAYQRLRGAVLLEPLFEEGPVAVIGLECEDFPPRSEEHTSELQSLMRTSYAVFCLKKQKNN